MHISLNKDKCKTIEGAFSVLKGDINNQEAVKLIKDTLEDSFRDYTFDVRIHRVVGTRESDKISGPIFYMSVYPELSTTDKIISAVLSNKETDAIEKIWKANKKWTIEIDDRVIIGNNSFSNSELTAMLLHELGHVVYTNSIPNRLSTIFKYEITKASISNRLLIAKDKLFRSILSLPILDTCISDNKRDLKSVKEEIKADSFVKRMGYSDDLYKVLTKMIESCKKNATRNEKIVKGTDYAFNELTQFQKRRDNITKNDLLRVKENCNSDYINEFLDEFIEKVFEDGDNWQEGRKLEYMHERADKDIQDEIVLEFFSLGGKKLKRIDPNDIDYIAIKIESISNESDKMMIISYINSKLDLVDYYIGIETDPKLAKKYNIPHTLNELYDIKKRLTALKTEAFKHQIPERNKNILIAWPTGYEG